MNLENIMAISGHSGLFKLIASRKSGIVAEHLVTNKKTFYSTRKHQFTPLQTVAIYTYLDAVEIAVVFEKMKTVPGMPKPNDSPEELHEYFGKVLNDYDKDRVKTSDIKKVLKWYLFLDERGLLLSDEEE